jgi:hypothetical protein
VRAIGVRAIGVKIQFPIEVIVQGVVARIVPKLEAEVSKFGIIEMDRVNRFNIRFTPQVQKFRFDSSLKLETGNNH